MHGPVFALDAVFDFLARRENMAGQPKHSGLRRLQVVPNRFAVMAEEFVAGDFHIHRAGMNLLQPGAIGANRPDAVDLVPWSFVAKHNQRRIGGRKLHVVEPVRVGMERIDGAASYVDCVKLHWQAQRPAFLQPASAAAGSWSGVRGPRACHITSGEQSFIGIDGNFVISLVAFVSRCVA